MVKRMTASVAAISALLLLFCAGAAAQQEGSRASAVRIGPGDLIDLIMYDNADLSGHFRVSEDGDVRLPLAGSVHLAGKTAEEAAATIEKRFVNADILKPSASHAQVLITEFATQSIVVTGEVRSPGVYPAVGTRMLNDLVSKAGGVQPTASTQILIAHRDDPKHPITVEYDPFSLKPVIPQMSLLPGDTVIVPKAGIVYVLGAVTHPGGIVLEGRNPLTVEKAMAWAIPEKFEAKLKVAQLVRATADGKKEMTTLDIRKILRGEAADVALKDGDILYVPGSTIKAMTPQVLSSMLGMATSIAVYRIAYH